MRDRTQERVETVIKILITCRWNDLFHTIVAPYANYLKLNGWFCTFVDKVVGNCLK